MSESRRFFTEDELKYLERFPIGDLPVGSMEWGRARSKWERAVFSAQPDLIAAARDLAASRAELSLLKTLRATSLDLYRMHEVELHSDEFERFELALFQALQFEVNVAAKAGAHQEEGK